MNGASQPDDAGFVGALRRFSQRRPAEERCDFCAAAIPATHRHLFEVETRKVICACTPCALRFESAVGRFKLIPATVRKLSNFSISDVQWESLGLPINLAFFRFDSPAGKTLAMYPSPAGATEGLLPAGRWDSWAAEFPALAAMKPDVEALLVNRTGSRRDYFLAPVDVCYELVGRIRMHWRGFTGGEEVWKQIDGFFAGLGERAESDSPETVREVEHA